MERVYTMTITKEEIEWVLSKVETEKKIKDMQYEAERNETFLMDLSVKVRDLLSGLGYDENETEQKGIFAEEWFKDFIKCVY